MDTQTLDAFQQKWEAVAAAESSQMSAGLSEKAQRQQRLSLACTLAREYLALGLPPPPSTAALTGHALEHYRKHKLQRKPRATAEVIDKLREALTAQEQFIQTQQTMVYNQQQEQMTNGQTYTQTESFRQPNQADFHTQHDDSSVPQLSRQQSKREVRAAKRAELEDAVGELREALQSSNPEAGQQAATRVAQLLRQQSSRRSTKEVAHTTKTERHRSHAQTRQTSPQHTSRYRTPSPNTHRSHNTATQTNARKPADAHDIASHHGEWGGQTGRGDTSHRSRDAACSPPPQARTLGETSLRFHTRPEWDDSFHLTRPTTPRPPKRDVVYAVDDATVPRNATSAAYKLSQWRNMKRVELARSLSPKREVPPGLTLMSSQLRLSSPLGRTHSSLGASAIRAGGPGRNAHRSPQRTRLGPNSRTPNNTRVLSGNSTARRGAAGGRGSGDINNFQAEQLQRVQDLESRMSRLISAVEHRLAASVGEQ